MSREIEDHRLHNTSGNTPFNEIVESHLSRRQILRGGLGLAAFSLMGGFGLGGSDPVLAGDKTPLSLAFEAVRGSRTDAVVVPEGYRAQVLIPWGTPLNAHAVAWRSDLAMTPEQQANSVGMHHDGMHAFPLNDTDGSQHFLLALNNEYIDQDALWAPQGGPTNPDGVRPADEVRTEIHAHGVTIVEIQRQPEGGWVHVADSPYNRRITTATPVALSGPVAGSDYVVTRYSTDGKRTRGTNNNCANGYTPWGTYLTCEENWPEVFVNTGERFADDARLGMPTDRGRYGWETAAGDDEQDGEFTRFDVTPRADNASDDYRNEARTFGYVVEIDPYTQASAIKRTALGRFRHEGCWPGPVREGEPLVFYTGHDSRNEYIYKFVSAANWNPADAPVPGNEADRLAVGNKYLDQGTLYAARFDDDGQGEWLPLTPDAVTPSGETLAEALGLEAGDLAGVIIHTCDAADRMGATPMDRPEWSSVDPVSGEVYFTLTNNSKRTESGSEATFTNGGSKIGDPGAGYATAPTNAANPRADNENGQIIRWQEQGSDRFAWEIFVFGSDAASDTNRSGLTETNQFASPDGLWYDERGDGRGILWFQTDNSDNAVAEYTNDQLLAVVPSALESGNGSAVVDGSNQNQLKRFAVGPNGCEVTGIFATPDRTALFINIQHPGNWPADAEALGQDATREAGATVRPRAATVAIWKADGGQIGV